ncbi:MAG: hypothetical protein LVR00_00535 [Rhabdochlamydiaceae bacterium]|jgi:ADP-ribose pyrophosphatase YjhB (NUDIX family)
MSVAVHEKEPEGFLAMVEVAACHIEIDGKLLLVKRAEHCQEPSTWCLPGAS